MIWVIPQILGGKFLKTEKWNKEISTRKWHEDTKNPLWKIDHIPGTLCDISKFFVTIFEEGQNPNKKVFPIVHFVGFSVVSRGIVGSIKVIKTTFYQDFFVSISSSHGKTRSTTLKFWILSLKRI